ncbi:MAG: hypothetical protein ABIP91_09070 [Sphingomicrobium sp.]
MAFSGSLSRRRGRLSSTRWRWRWRWRLRSPRSSGEDYGKFAWILDPDGVKVELWQQQLGPAPD